VRYLKIEQSMDERPQQVSHWIATIQYAYAAASRDPGIRRWNPLGFKIVSFVAEPEVIRDLPGQAAAGSGTGDVPGAASVKGVATP
jgi:type IV secretion system protein VirB8